MTTFDATADFRTTLAPLMTGSNGPWFVVLPADESEPGRLYSGDEEIEAVEEDICAFGADLDMLVSNLEAAI